MGTASKSLAFSAWLRGRRAELGQEQVEAAAAVGVSDTTWIRWERGGEPIKVKHIRALARWAGVRDVEVFELISAGQEDTAGAA